MTELELFQVLKGKVLQRYKEHYPFFTGTWKTFSSQDIQQLIVLIENECKQSISEKWIYTHLKPESNHKMPRKDMLDILSAFVGYAGWDELIFEHKKEDKSSSSPKKRLITLMIIIGSVMVGIAVGYFTLRDTKATNKKELQLANEYTDQKISSDEVRVFQIQDSLRHPVKVKDGKVELEAVPKRNTKLEITSPFYKRKIVDVVVGDTALTKVGLQPNDYAMMLKAFMMSDIKDWETRKAQLDKILSDDLEVIVMLKNDLGAEYFNKKEFVQKLIVPTASVKSMRIIELKNDEKGIIQFIRIKQ